MPHDGVESLRYAPSRMWVAHENFLRDNLRDVYVVEYKNDQERRRVDLKRQVVVPVSGVTVIERSRVAIQAGDIGN